MNILIIKLGAIGDVLRTTAVLPGLKAKHPDCEISWVAQAESFDILKDNEFINKIYLIGEKIIDNLKDKDFDLVISLDDDAEACELASSVNSKKIIGAYMESGKRVYTEDSALWFDMGLISRFGKAKADELKTMNKKTYQEIIYEILGLDYKKQRPILSLNAEELNFGKKFLEKNDLGKNDLIIGLNTGAGGRWQDKKLSVDGTVSLINKLDIKNAKLLLFGGPEEKERNQKIKESAKVEIIDTGCDNSLMEFASLINLCNILVTSDSLALHIGVALRKKDVVFFYPTSANEIELYGKGLKIIGKGKSYCSYQTKCSDPPEWDVGEIVGGVRKLLAK